jgi:hypothetical protein
LDACEKKKFEKNRISIDEGGESERDSLEIKRLGLRVPFGRAASLATCVSLGRDALQRVPDPGFLRGAPCEKRWLTGPWLLASGHLREA